LAREETTFPEDDCLELSPQKVRELSAHGYHTKPVEKKIARLHHVTAIASDSQRNLDFYMQSGLFRASQGRPLNTSLKHSMKPEVHVARIKRQLAAKQVAA
jgi:hypothetical protein